MGAPFNLYGDNVRLPTVPGQAAPAERPVATPDPGDSGTTVDPNSDEAWQILHPGQIPEARLPDEGTETSQDHGESIIGDTAAKEFWLRGGGSAAPQKEILSGRKYGTVGGKDLLDSATEGRPEAVGQALQMGAEAADKEGQEMAGIYKNRSEDAQRAAVVHRAQAEQDAQEIQRRQKVLEQHTEAYTADLADNGKFWRNPGNIVAAIAYSLMPITSNDPGVGVKLINQAVQQDLADRKGVADMHLGELRSNLGGYRKLVGDRQAGDQLAEAEAYRIAATDIQRIASSYQGPKAKAQAMAMAEEFQQKADILRMNVFAGHVNMDPTAMDPRLAAAWRQHTGVVLDPKTGKPQVGATPGGLPSQQGAPTASGRPVGASSGGGAYPGQELGKGATVSRASDQPSGGPGGDSFEGYMGRSVADLVNDRNPNSAKNIDVIDHHLSVLASAKTGLPVNDRGDKMRHAKEEIIADWDKKIDPVLSDLQKSASRRAGYTALSRDVNMLESKFKGNDAQISAFLGGIRQYASGTARQWDQGLAKMGIVTEPDREMANRFRQVLAKNINAYFKDTSGGAIQEHESKRLEAYINGDATWSAIKRFTRDMSTESAAEYGGGLSRLPAGARELAVIRLGQGGQGLNTPGARKK